MNIIQIVSIGIVATILIRLLGTLKSGMGSALRVAVSVVMLIGIISQLGVVIDIIRKMGEAIDTEGVYMGIIFKIIGIAYIAEFGAQICKDAEEGAIASKIELAGKVFIMVVSAPIVLALMDMVTNMLL